MEADPALIESLRAVAHPVRWRILQTLASAELSVGQIEAEADISQPGLSQQLAVLRQTGLVMARKSARQVYYRVCANHLARLSEALAAVCPTVSPTGQAAAAPEQRPLQAGAAQFARVSVQR